MQPPRGGFGTQPLQLIFIPTQIGTRASASFLFKRLLSAVRRKRRTMKNKVHRQHILENLIYALIWIIVFTAPVFRVSEETGFSWKDVTRQWMAFLPFFAVFCINNYVLIPYLLTRKRMWWYFLITAGMVFVIFTTLPHPRHHNTPPRRTFTENTTTEQRVDRPENVQSRKKGNEPPPFKIPFRRILFFNCILIAIFVIGINIAIKLLFKSIRDERQMKELEKQNLQTELEYLKHQINPHFFMNTLNNIHALIDIDAEKAKETVIELSKIMRYILYDSSQPLISLQKEITLINNYIALMRIRYTDSIDITMSVPERLPDVQLPPLLFITFIENAFKHGISYRHASFVHVSIEVQEKELSFYIMNSSNNTAPHDTGIGLENVTKRLNLLYGNKYTLSTREEENVYSVTLVIPLQS